MLDIRRIRTDPDDAGGNAAQESEAREHAHGPGHGERLARLREAGGAGRLARPLEVEAGKVVASGTGRADTTGDAFICADAIALMPLVTPGPAVSAHTPGSRVTFAHPSAANAALCSWRTSTMSMPSSRQPS